MRDERNDTRLDVIGELPEGLVGAYMRNGGNPFFTSPGGYHVFDGDGMVHGIYLDDDGTASYSNRWVRSRGLEVERERGRAVYGGLSEFSLPDDDAIVAACTRTPPTPTSSTTGRYLALMEGAHPPR